MNRIGCGRCVRGQQCMCISWHQLNVASLCDDQKIEPIHHTCLHYKASFQWVTVLRLSIALNAIQYSSIINDKDRVVKHVDDSVENYVHLNIYQMNNNSSQSSYLVIIMYVTRFCFSSWHPKNSTIIRNDNANFLFSNRSYIFIYSLYIYSDWSRQFVSILHHAIAHTYLAHQIWYQQHSIFTCIYNNIYNVIIITCSAYIKER